MNKVPVGWPTRLAELGVKPDVAVTADQALDAAHKLALEKLLAAADDEAKKLINTDLERSKERR